ncbi:hypothetical protein JTE90_008930 [Oedothorax gibbosus]|uniref:RNA cytidine acetyltransferase n=1 Tax=Oedothorax gibbosus TaxID=931172 RepID=A0AAV6UQ09_9ARAC|nr:hypothetical protein JTE90_008930 [Oedothorax gibbosus]
MVRKKIDNRIRILIENGVALHHRSLFVVVGEKGRDCISILHEMLSKAEVKARPTVLWCYKKDLGFSSHKKTQKRLKKAHLAQGKQHLDENDSIEYFVASTNIRYCYYSETHSIMGQTFGMAILQDFEAITPNLLARTIETVEGGGMILLLLQTITSIKQLYTMTMDVHARYRTEAHQNIVCRFNERFILSLIKKCSSCLFLDDKLNILPIKSNALTIKPIAARAWDSPKTPKEQELVDLKASLDGSQPMHVLVKKCKTFDQAKAVQMFIESLSEKTLRSTVTLTSARGRGKSAALGLAVAAAIAYKYPNIAVTSPHPENLKTFFKFLLEGLDALGYEKATDYEEIRSTVPEHNKAIIQVNITRKLRQRVRYILPANTKLDNVELLVIDEAAAIPLPFVKALMGPYLIFLASTINGYEGTGRSLSLKLISQLRKQQSSDSELPEKAKTRRSLARRVLHEPTLNESIRYKQGDKIEAWLNDLLCLDVTVPPASPESVPDPEDCKLYPFTFSLIKLF